MLTPYNFNVKIYASSQQEVEASQEAFMDLIRDFRSMDIAITAKGLTEALVLCRTNSFARTQISNHFKKKQ